MIKSALYSIKQAFKQMFRNKGMTFASIFAITAMMLILSLFLFLSVNVEYLTETVKNQFGTIEVFLLDETSKDQAENMIVSFKEMDGVEDAVYVSKEQAMEEFKIRWGDNAYLLNGLTENPLPNAIRITLSDLNSGDIIARFCATVQGVEDVRFYRDEVGKVVRISNIIQRGALVVIAFLVIISIVVVSNTIKLTVMARENEITIMKYIGATNWFIRGPMFFEGIIIGLISAAVSVGLSSLIYVRLCKVLGDQAFRLFSTQLVMPQFLITNIVWIFLALGISIGACGSIISMRRYLKA
ncbi:MAG: permease-like cell division protein FtsX [Firmicutes bacterium]|nr:permease-like cell division protein FtsX [Bacillota bacterium]